MAQTKVTKPGIADDAVETSTIKNLNVTNAKIAAGTIDVTAKITGIVPAANLGTGTASATTYLAGDGSYKALSEYDDNQVQSNIAMLGFKVAVNGSLTRYNLIDQSIDEFYDTSGVDASTSTNERRVASGDNYYYEGATTVTPTVTEDADATGTDGDYSWYKWTDTAATGSYQTNVAQNYDIFVLAGGGGGGAEDGGGGAGAGGFKYYSQKTDIGTSSITVTIGAGGAAGVGTNNGTNGVNSSFGSLIATGGGGGGHHQTAGTVGGSGGAGGGRNTAAGGAGTANQGYAGGNSAPGSGTSVDTGGGGGGASAVGANGADNGPGGNGGAGYTEGTSTVYDWFAADGSTETFDIDGLSVGYAGGGGGGSETGSPGTATHGGAAGQATAVANKGGGGGGSGPSPGTDAGTGGSGVVIIRRLTAATSVSNLTLQSTDSTAGSAPTYGEFVTLIENAAGTATLNTDIKGYISRDSGTTFTQGTLVDEGTWGTNKKVLGFHDLDISSQPSGTSMCYKITTHNQVASSKETRVYATSIGWR
jgi:hypothetical protein